MCFGSFVHHETKRMKRTHPGPISPAPDPIPGPSSSGRWIAPPYLSSLPDLWQLIERLERERAALRAQLSR